MEPNRKAFFHENILVNKNSILKSDHSTVDTPGFLDSKGNDRICLTKLVEYMKEISILTFNSYQNYYGILHIFPTSKLNSYVTRKLGNPDSLITNKRFQHPLKENHLNIFKRKSFKIYLLKFFLLMFISFLILFFFSNIPSMIIFANAIDHEYTIINDTQNQLSFVSNIIFIGSTGAGKSFLCNHFSGTKAFIEGSGTCSQTNEILSVISSRNQSHIIVDTPGLLDSNGNDQMNLKNLVEYMKGKSILSVIYVATGRINLVDRYFINELLGSAVKDNLLVVFNKYNGDNNNFINSESFNVLPFKMLLPEERNYSDSVNEQLQPILTWINKKQPVSTNHFKQPIGLFKQPIQITHEDKDVRENIVSFDKQVMEKVTKYHKKRVSVKVGDRWRGFAGRVLGIKKFVFEERDIDEPYEIEELVTKKYLKYDKYHVKYALRFDDMTAVYAKEYLGTFEEPQKY